MKLTNLYIKDFKSISQLTISPGTFTAITGLNGTGKSNVIDAISFILCANTREMRVSKITELIRHGTDSAIVEIGFMIHTDEYKRMFSNFSEKQKKAIDKIEEFPTMPIKESLNSYSLTIRKEITQNNKTKILINNHPITIGKLEKILSYMQLLVVRQGTITKVANNDLNKVLYESIGCSSKDYLQSKLTHLEIKEKKLNALKEQKLRIIRPYFDAIQTSRMRIKEKLDIEKRLKNIKKLKNKYNYTLQKYLEMKDITIENELKVLREKFSKQSNNESKKELKMKVIESQEELKNLIFKNEKQFEESKFEDMKKKIVEKRNLINELEEKIKLGEKGRNVVELDNERNKIQEEIEFLINSCDCEIYTDLLTNQENLIKLIENKKQTCEKMKKLTIPTLKHLNNHFLLNTYGRVYENFTVSNEYKIAIDTILMSKRNYILVEKADYCSEGNGTFIPLDKIITNDEHTQKLRNPVLNSAKAINFIQFHENLRKGFIFLLSNFYIFKDSNKAKEISQKEKVITVTLDGTVYDWRGVVSGGKINLREHVSKREVSEEFDYVIKTLTDLNKIFNVSEQDSDFEIISKLLNDIKEGRNGRSKNCNFNGQIDHINKQMKYYMNKKQNDYDSLQKINQKIIQCKVINDVIQNDNSKKVTELRNLLIKTKRQLFELNDEEEKIQKILEFNDGIREFNQKLQIRQNELQKFISENEAILKYEEEETGYEKRYEIKRRMMFLENEVNEKNKTHLKNSMNDNFSVEDEEEEHFTILDELKEKVQNKKLFYDDLKNEMRDFVINLFESQDENNDNSFNQEKLKNKRTTLLDPDTIIIDKVQYLNVLDQNLKKKMKVEEKSYVKEMCDTNEKDLNELNGKLQQLEKDKKRINESIIFLEKESKMKIQNLINHLNANVNEVMNHFLKGIRIKVTDEGKMEIFSASGTENNNINFTELFLHEMSGGQKSLIAVAIMFTCVNFYNKARNNKKEYETDNILCLFDEIDSALDPAQTEKIASFLRSRNCQTVVVSLKDGFWRKAERVFEVFREGGGAKVQRIK